MQEVSKGHHDVCLMRGRKWLSFRRTWFYHWIPQSTRWPVISYASQLFFPRGFTLRL